MKLDWLALHALEDRMAGALLGSVLSAAEGGLDDAVGAATDLRNTGCLVAALTAAFAHIVSPRRPGAHLADERRTHADSWSPGAHNRVLLEALCVASAVDLVLLDNGGAVTRPDILFVRAVAAARIVLQVFDLANVADLPLDIAQDNSLDLAWVFRRGAAFALCLHERVLGHEEVVACLLSS